MARTPSTMLPLGTRAPDFNLLDFDGQRHALADFAGARALLIVFTCEHCPFARHVRVEFARFAAEYLSRGLAIVAVNSNDLGAYPQDGADAMRTEARTNGYGFPYLIDADQSLAKACRASCTPDFFLFDGDRRLAYRGQFDASRPGDRRTVTGADLRRAADTVLAGRPVEAEQRPSLGCNIKWKPGAAPDYYQG